MSRYQSLVFMLGVLVLLRASPSEAQDQAIPLANVMLNPAQHDGKVFWLVGTPVLARTSASADGSTQITIILKNGSDLIVAFGDARRDASALNAASLIQAMVSGSVSPTVMLFGKFNQRQSPDGLDKYGNGYFVISNVIAISNNVFCLARDTARCPKPPAFPP